MHSAVSMPDKPTGGSSGVSRSRLARSTALLGELLSDAPPKFSLIWRVGHISMPWREVTLVKILASLVTPAYARHLLGTRPVLWLKMHVYDCCIRIF